MTTKLTEHKGTGVGVYGTVSPVGNFNAPPCSYSVDGGRATTQVATMINSTQYHVLFFQSAKLTEGSHTLVITTLPEVFNTFWLDYFAVTPLPIATALPIVAASPLPSSACPLPSSTCPLTSSTSKPPVGPVIGGVLGALALLTLALIAFLFFRWKKKEPLYHRKAYSADSGGAL